jgi:tetratricopeptide (TPR) repeat protein
LAIAAYRRALELRADVAEAHNNLGNALKRQGKLEEAIECYQRALSHDSAYALAYANLGAALEWQRQWDEATACYRTALQLNPHSAVAWTNLGDLLKSQGCREEAFQCLRRAVELEPDSADAHLGLAYAFLLYGQYREGWREHEYRLTLRTRNCAIPRWNGEPLGGKAIFLHWEGGFGDILQFVRYVLLLRSRTNATRVVLECRPALERLFAASDFSNIEIVASDGEIRAVPPDIDWQLPLLSLPLALDVTEPLPMPRPYLAAEAELRATWKNRLGARSRFRVGLVWKGNPGHRRDWMRSISCEQLIPLLELPDVEFFNLQVDGRQEEVASLTSKGVVDFTGQIADFADLAALIPELDLVISVDSAVAHLAGALGHRVWTLIPYAPDWRWGIEGDSTPWYPSMRLFRQPKPGEWDSVLRCVANELQTLVQASGSGCSLPDKNASHPDRAFGD